MRVQNLIRSFTRPNRGQRRLRPVEWKLFANCQNPFNFSQKLRNYVCERVHAHTSPTRGQNFLPALHAVRACTTKICFPFRARKRLTERRARNPGGKQRRNEFVYLRFPARVGTRKQKENREGKKKNVEENPCEGKYREAFSEISRSR